MKKILLRVMHSLPLKVFFIFCSLAISVPAHATTTVNWNAPELQPLQQFLIQEHMPINTAPALIFIDKSQLPSNAAFILT